MRCASRWGQPSPSPPRGDCRPSSPPPGAPRPPPPLPLPGGPIAAAAALGAVGPTAPGLQVGAGLRERLGPVAGLCSACWAPPGTETRLTALEPALYLAQPPPPPLHGAANSINPLFEEMVRIIMPSLRFFKDVALFGGVIRRCIASGAS